MGNPGDIIRTTDGGATWDSIPLNTTYAMRDLDVQGDILVACGDFGRIIRSTDAGLTWTVVQMGNTGPERSVSCRTVPGSWAPMVVSTGQVTWA